MLPKVDIRSIVINAQQPIVLRSPENLQKWSVFQKGFEEWAHLFDAAQLSTHFDVGYKKFPSLPQFECFRTTKAMTMKDFLSIPVDDELWYCHNYKYLKDCPEECRKGINFDDLGFPEVGEDITFWIGKAGSHTPAHYDSYGCNIVVQVFGRKSWLLFPNSSAIDTQTRIPYEESSVYSTLSFYSPDLEKLNEFSGLKNSVHHVILEPGDILIVPPKWWHYVECLTDSLNFNTWIKLTSDVDAQIEECITRLLLKDYVTGLSSSVTELLLNPNEMNLLDEPVQTLQETLTYLVNLKITGKRNTRMLSHGFLSHFELTELLQQYQDSVHSILPMSDFQFYELLKTNSKRHTAELVHPQIKFFKILLKDHNCLNITLRAETVRSIKASILGDGP